MPFHIQLAAEFPKWEFKSLTAPIGIAFVPLGTPTVRPAKEVIITSTVNQDLIFCFDGSGTDQFRLPAGNATPQVITIPFRTFNSGLPALVQVQVRAAVAAATGTISATFIGAVSQ